MLVCGIIGKECRTPAGNAKLKCKMKKAFKL